MAHRLTEQHENAIWAAGYHAGRLDAYRELAGWIETLVYSSEPPPPRIRHELVVAARVAEMEECAARFHQEHGTRQWFGEEHGYDQPTNARSPDRCPGPQSSAPRKPAAEATTTPPQPIRESETSVYEHSVSPHI